jgi:hypothetical protein
MAKPVRFTRGSRKHRIGRERVWQLMASWPATEIPASVATDRAWLWIGTDDRGLRLEIIAIETPEIYLVIHVMPTDYRK